MIPSTIRVPALEAVAGSRRSARSWNVSGKPRYAPLTANTSVNPRLQKPIMLCKCQVRRFHPRPRCNVTAAPRLDARPPDHQTGDSESKHGECANAVHLPAGFASEQIVVQIEKIRDDPGAGSNRCAKIAAGPRIEQPIPGYFAALQPDIYRLIRISRPSQIYNAVARVQARGGLSELLVGQCWSRTLRDDWFRSGCSIKLVPINDH